MEQLKHFFAPPSDDTDKTLWAKVKRFLVPPIFEDEEKTRIGRITHTVLLIMLIATIIIPGIYLVRAIFLGEAVTQLLGVILIAGSSLLAFLALNKRGYVYVAASALIILFLFESFYLIYGENSLDNSLILNFILPIIIAGLLLGHQASGLTAFASVVLIGVASVDEVTTIRELLGSRLLAYTGVFLAITFLIRLASDSIRDALTQLRHSNQELQNVQNLLEVRVSNRTRDLTLAAEIGRRVAQEHSLDQLLPIAVERIRETFALYYAQIYLTDPTERLLVLRAGSGAVGEQLLRRGHRLPIDFGSINGSAAQSKKAVLVEDTVKSLSFLPNPLLPNTRSEMSVPLLSGERLLGVLNMQSEHPNTFTQETLPAYEILAGQLAAAISNAYQFAEIEQTRLQVEAQSRLLARSGWDSYLDAVHQPEYLGVVYRNGEVETFTTPTVYTTEKSHVVPISVAGEEIGSVQLETENGALADEEQEVVTRLAALAGQHMENLRLLTEAERYRREAEQAARRLTHEGWETYHRSAKDLASGYIYTQNQVKPIAQTEGENETFAISHPLTVRGEAIGTLKLEAPEYSTNSSGGETDELVAIVAETLTAHIENLRLSQATELALGQAETLYNLTSQLSQADTLDQILEAVTELRGATSGTLLTIETDTDGAPETLTILTTWPSEVARTPKGTRFPIHLFPGSSVWINHSGGALIFANAETDPRLDTQIQTMNRQYGIKSMIYLPLKAGNKWVGLLLLSWTTPQTFAESDSQLFDALAAQCAIVVNNRLLFEQTSKRANRETLINTINQRIQRSTSMESALETTAREIGHLLKARRTIAEIEPLGGNRQP